MNSISKNLVLLGVKHTIIAFDRTNGRRIWVRDLGARLSGTEYVSLLADGDRVYAHTHGEVFCLDLATGKLLWSDQLAGFGYGLASIAIPGGPVLPASDVAEVVKQQQNAASAATTG